MRRRDLSGWSLAALFLGASPALATTYYVDDTGPGGDGSSWSEAFVDLQEALDQPLADGDEIWVAEGLYIPSRLIGSDDPRAATFYLEYSGVKIYGGFPEGGGDWLDRDPLLYPTVLSGDLWQDDLGDGPGLPSKLDNAFQVVRFATDLANTTVLDGFEIRDGYGFVDDPDVDGRSGCGITLAGPTYPQIANCRVYDNHTAVGFAFGGGVEVGNNAEPTFTNCHIHDNSAQRGGGVYCDRSFATFIDCIIEANAAPSGAGMRCTSASPSDVGTITLTDCFFMNNVGTGLSVADNYTINMTGGEVSGNTSGGMYLEGAGMVDGVLITGNSALDSSGGGVILRKSDCTVTIKNCEISFNTVVSDAQGVSGGGISCALDASPRIVDCQILYNAADPGSFAGGGGGMAVGADCVPTISRCLFEGNEASEGGGLYNSSDTVIRDCTFRGNLARTGSGLYNYNYGSISAGTIVRGCVFLENTKRPHDTNYGYGGAIRNRTPISVIGCTFFGNEATRGGAIFNEDTSGDSLVGSSIFVGNTAHLYDDMYDGWGGGVYNSGNGLLDFVNCTLNANHAADRGGGLFVMSGQVNTANCIYHDNSDAAGGPMGEIDTEGPGATVDVNYCNVEGGWATGDGNIDVPPGYRDIDGLDDIVGTEDDDLRLWLADTCNDAGDNDAVSDLGVDLDGAPRRRDDPWADDTGNGGAPVVDMGAYEIADCQPNDTPDDLDIADGTSLDDDGNGIPDECQTCVGDVDGDGDTDQGDLGALLASYGRCAGDPGYNPNADLDGDDCVGQADLGILLGDWGCTS